MKPQVFNSHVFEDERGWFCELCTDLSTWKQENLSHSKRGVLRGLHTQTPAQAKLISVVQGEIFDACVCLKTGKVYTETLTVGKHFYIPKGYAHGFQVVSETALVLYKCSELYNPDTQVTIPWDSVGIDWPIDNPILSEKDSSLT